MGGGGGSKELDISMGHFGQTSRKTKMKNVKNIKQVKMQMAQWNK